MKRITILLSLIMGLQLVSPAQNHCLSFDGNDWVDCGTDPALNPENGSFTIEFWANRGYNAGGMHAVTKGYYQASPAGGHGWNFRCNMGDKRMYFQVGTVTYASAIEQVRSDDGLWHHFAGVIDRVNNLVILYKDGLFEESNNISSIGSIAVSDPLFIGKTLNHGYGEEPWVGHLDEIRVWNSAKTQAQILQSMYQSIQNPAAVPDLIAYYNLDEGSGQTAFDISQNANNGQLGSTPNPDGNDPTWGNCVIPGFNVQNCLDFDGSNDYVRIPHQPYHDFGANDFTVSFWFFKRNATRGHAVTFSGLVNNNLAFDFDDNDIYGGVNLWVYWMGSGYPGIIVAKDYSDGLWHHCALTRSGSSVTLYVDGKPEGQTTYNGSFVFADDLLVGWSNSYLSYSFFWDGKVDELQIWNKALTHEDICNSMHYIVANPASDPDLLGYYSFNEISGTNLPDLSINGNDGTLISMDPASDWIFSEAPGIYENIASVQSGNWDNPATWGGLIPGPCSNVQINHAVWVDADKIHLEEISIAPSSNLTVDYSTALTVNGNLTNNGGTGGLTLKSGPSGTASLIEYSTAPASVERYFSGNNIDWHLVSSPVSNAVSGVFTGMYLQGYTESTGAYYEIISTAAPLNPMKGFGLYSNLGSANTVLFEGNLNSGNVSAGLSAVNPYGWNLLGNPYPSSVDWNAVTIPSGMNNAVYYLDAVSGNFLSYNGSIGSGSRYIPPMQGFFVSANASAVLSLNNSVRSHTGSDNFYKEKFQELLVIKAEGNGYSDKAYIRFNAQATSGFDGKYDAYKLFAEHNPALPQVFTLTSQDYLSINELPATGSVALGFRSGMSGDYLLETEMAGDFGMVMLEDLKTGSLTNLLDESYRFRYQAGEDDARFMLYFKTKEFQELKEGNIRIFTSGKSILIDSGLSGDYEVSVFNLTGQRVSGSSVRLNGLTILEYNLTEGLYIVQVHGNGTVHSDKVFIK